MWHNPWFPEDVPISGREAALRKEELREVYNSRYGQRVLTHLLSTSFFFTSAANPEETALSNNAKMILGHMGIWVPENREQIVNALLSIPSPPIDIDD